MGSMTAANIISEGLLLAGDTSLSNRALVWLNTWLRSQYMAWPWPVLQRKASNIALAAGVGTLNVGGGTGGLAGQIQRIYDPLYIYNAGKTQRSVVRLRELTGGSVAFDEDARPLTQRGLPNKVKAVLQPTTFGSWDLIFDPIPDQAYLLSFNYTLQPVDVGTSETPLYQNDRTMIHLIASMAFAYMGDERASEMREIVASMTTDDRNKYGKIVGLNDSWQLDGSTFGS